MTRARLELGKRGEDLAFQAVKQLGYKQIVRNYRCSQGEVDLIARDGATLVFIEIKTRRTRSASYAKEAVNRRKQRQLSKVALAYMKANDCEEVSARFDVVAIGLLPGEAPEIEIVRDAFELDY
ncbi:MAG: YraN family protein [Deltaproteobacteria bacterium]|nr:YraN family protein [Deltaproteobacteria bacterium]MBW1816599.1 YraN family protein [Deltaproteobacteria bacterium]MBW2283146.1 YraN family protein [Deltaproteobacteria bacterium]